MASLNSIQYQNYVDAIALGIGAANPASSINGKIRVARFDVETTGDASGSTLNLTVVPAGAVYLFTIIAYEGTGSLTLDIGDSGDADRLVNDASLGSDNPTSASLLTGFYTRLDSTAFGTAGPEGNDSSSPAFGWGYKYTTQTVITGTTAGASMTSGEVIRGAIVYVIE